MPLVADSDLPAFEDLRREGLDVASPSAAQGERLDLRLGLVNLMPDGSIVATERQFLRLLTVYPDANVRVRLFTATKEPRGEKTLTHMQRHYLPFAKIRSEGLDAIIVTGANPHHERLCDEAFWPELRDILAWAHEHTHSILCSCLAVHAVFQLCHGAQRIRLPKKAWGVFPHRVADQDHALLEGVEPAWSAPHSHFYEICRTQMEAAKVQVLVESEEAGVYLAVAAPPSKWLFAQGHPEYDAVSLLKEYKRETARYFAGELAQYPPFPEHYFPAEAQRILREYRASAEAAHRSGLPLPAFPETRVLPDMDAPWKDASRQIFVNWLRQIEIAVRAATK